MTTWFTSFLDTFACFFHLLISLKVIFFKKKNISGIPAEGRSIWIQVKSDLLKKKINENQKQITKEKHVRQKIVPAQTAPSGAI